MDIFKLVGSIFIRNEEANKGIDDTTEKAKKLSETLGNKMESVGKTMTNVGKKLAPVSLAVGGILTASVKGASDFNDGMAKMSTLFDTTTTDVKKLSKEFLNLSSKTGVAGTELAEAGYQALSAGVDVKNSVNFVEKASNLARAGFTSTATAVDVLTTAINAYGLSADDAEALSNKLVRTQNLGKTTVDELASAMGRVIPTASSMNVNIDNLTSGYVALTKQGISTAESTTYINSMLNELGKSSTTAGKILKEKTGKSFQELMNDGMSLADVLQIMKKYSDETGVGFNELWGSAEAGKAGLSILSNGVEEFNDTVDIMASKTDDVGQALEKMDTPSVKLKRSLNQLKNSGIELGTAFITSLTPTIELLAGGVEKLTNWFSGLPEPIKTIISTTMVLIAIASPILIIGGKVIGGIESMLTAVSKMTKAIKAGVTVIKGLGTAFSFLTSPIGLIIVAIGLFVGAVIYLWNTNEDFRNAVIKIWGSIRDFVKGIIDAICKLFSGFMDYINGVGENFSDLKETISKRMSENWQSVKNGVDKICEFFGNLMKKGEEVIQKFNDIGKGIKNKMDEAREAVKTAIEKIKGFFNFEWKLPKLKMPHFKVSGSANPLEWLSKGVPKISVEWYRKAMDEPYMFTDPTIFGVNGYGNAMGAGEAGDEIMYGRRNLMNDIRSAVSSELKELLLKIIEIIEEIANRDGEGGDTIIPVYLGTDLIDEVVADSKKRRSIRSGGLVSV